jgi:hypothetical protein
MKTFPKCQVLQECACAALHNLAYSNVTGKKQAIESGGIEVVLAAVDNHLDSADVCEHARKALVNIVSDSSLWAVELHKVRTKWADNNDDKTQVRKLAGCFAAEWKARNGKEKKRKK